MVSRAILAHHRELVPLERRMDRGHGSSRRPVAGHRTASMARPTIEGDPTPA